MKPRHRVSRALVRLYPRRWRERYAAEFLALLESTSESLGTAFDVFRGGLAEWRQDLNDRLIELFRARGRRAAVIKWTVFLAFLAVFGIPSLMLGNAICSTIAAACIRAGWVLPAWAGFLGVLATYAATILGMYDRDGLVILPRPVVFLALVVSGTLAKWDHAIHGHFLLFSQADLWGFVPGSFIGTLILFFVFRRNSLQTRNEPAPPKSDLTVLNLSGALGPAR